MRVLAAIWVLTASCTAFGQSDPGSSVVITDDKAFVVLAPDVLAGPDVRSVDWSPDGKYALLVRVVPPKPSFVTSNLSAGPGSATFDDGQCELLLFDAKAGRTFDVSTLPYPRMQFTSVEWFRGAPSAVVTTVEQGSRTDRFGLLVVDAVRRAAKIVVDVPELFQISLSPTHPFGMLTANGVDNRGNATGERVVHSLSAAGAIGPPIKLPSRFPALFPTASGTWAYTEGETRLPDAKTFEVDFVAGTVKRVAHAEPFRRSMPKTDLKVVEDLRPLTTNGVRTVVRASVLTSSTSPSTPDAVSMVLGTDVALSVLSPTGNAVIVCSRGATFVHAIAEVPRPAAIAAYAMSQRKAAMENSRACSIAALMYANDFDGVLPTPDNFQDKFAPYIKTRDMLDNFVYTFSGGDIAGLKNPKETEIGYVAGPGGRAVAFADGHTRWVPDN